MRVETNDEIQAILRQVGIYTPHLERLHQVSLEMREMEWRMMRRTAAVPAFTAAPTNRSGD